MGQTLSSPATDKKSESSENGRFYYAVTEMQGWRISMEDAHATVLNLDGDDAESSNTFFAVYDGHGGGTVAKFAGENVHKRLVKEEAYHDKRYEAALKRAFLGTDEDLLANPVTARDPSGCTAVAALISQDKIYVANAGDSRSVLSFSGEAKPLSFDHKPTNEVEKQRISGAGGYVEYGRVNGNLALSRAIGDFDFKKNYALTPERQIITSDPDVTCHDITGEDEFLVLACDGIWDCLTSQQVVDFVRYQVSEGKSLTEIGEMMCDHCLAPDTSSGAGIGCDNMTVLIVAVLNGRTKEEWVAWITDRVKTEYGYKTPTTVPQLYAASRIAAFKSRQEAWERRQQHVRDSVENGTPSYIHERGALSGFARVLGSNGGISFQPGGSIMSDTGTLMFGNDESDSDDSGDDEAHRSLFSDLGGVTHTFPDSRSLKAQLEEYEKEDEEHLHAEDQQTLSDNMAHALPNGDAIKPVEQFKSLPGGDAASPVVKAEGLMDTSEDPTKV